MASAHKHDSLLTQNHRLPEKGNFGLSIDARPFLNYAGAIFSNTGASAPSFSFGAASPLTITGRYFLTDATAYRLRLRIGAGSTTTRNSVLDQVNTTLDTVYTTDRQKVSATNINLGFGKEWRRGGKRIQGYYGYEGSFSFTSAKTTYQYGNQFSSTNTSVLSTDFSQALPGGAGFQTAAVGSRINSVKQGAGFGLGARGFVGVEWFFTRKMSLGGEFGWGFILKNQNDGNTVVESWDNVNNGVRSKTLISGGNQYFGVDTDNQMGSIHLNFYF